MNRTPPELPNIEDATLRACLAPLMDAMNTAMETVVANPPRVPVEPAPHVPAPHVPAPHVPAPHVSARGLPHVLASSNDNPVPRAGPAAAHPRDYSGVPPTLAEWRSLTDDDHGAFRTVELFLAMTDAELDAAAAEFPKQIGGTLARIVRLKERLAAQYDTLTVVTVLLDRAMARAVPLK